MKISDKKYQIIYADPPWEYADQKNNDPKMGGITYPIMKLQDIKNLPVQSISQNNCALALWVTMPLLKEGIEVVEAWGFKYVTCLFNWIKLNPSDTSDRFCITESDIYSGMGHWVNGNAELCLFAKKGSPKRMVKNVKQIQMWPRGRHSAKPPQIRNEIVRLFGDLPRIELFARQKTDGWDVWGNEV
jgi:N6-adenosine-specific RNA methylase IME4